MDINKNEMAVTLDGDAETPNTIESGENLPRITEQAEPSGKPYASGDANCSTYPWAG